jgi:hypothetical protein
MPTAQAAALAIFLSSAETFEFFGIESHAGDTRTVLHALKAMKEAERRFMFTCWLG